MEMLKKIVRQKREVGVVESNISCMSLPFVNANVPFVMAYTIACLFFT